MKGLNQDLRTLKDGAQSSHVELAIRHGVERKVGRIYVFWPFVVFKTVYAAWNITHAPTGLHVSDASTLAKARRLIEAMRGAADFNFTSAKAKKARHAEKATRSIRPPRFHVA